MKIRSKVFLNAFILLLYLAGFTPAQEAPFRFKHYSIEEGLSEVNARCIVRDEYGFLWIGTQDGLNRYDGYEFTVFRHNENDSCSIADNFISALLKDDSGRLWIGTRKGLSVFYPAKGEFENYFCARNKSVNETGGGISAIYQDSDSIIWVGFENGKVIKFDKNKDSLNNFWTKKENIFGFSRSGINSIYEDSHGILWFATSGRGLFAFNKVNGKWENFRHKSKTGKSYYDVLFALTEDSKGNIIIGSFKGLVVYNPNRGNFQNYFVFKNNNRFLKIGSDILTGVHVRSLFKDKNGNLWVGTLLEGLFFLKKGKTSFVNYKNDPANPFSISNNNIFDFYESGGILWIGTGKGGINKLDRRKKYFANINQLTHGISNNSIGAVLEDSRGNLWIGTDRGLNKIDAVTKEITQFFHSRNDEYSLSNNKITALAEDKFGNIWVGTQFGLNKFEPSENKFFRFVHSTSAPGNLPFYSIRYIYCDDNGKLWLATSGGGLIKFIPGKKLFTQYKVNPSNRASINDNMLTHIRQDRQGILWICTRSSISKFYPDREMFENINFKRGEKVLANFLCSFEDNEGIVWIGAEDGLIKYNPGNGQYRIYTERDGLLGREIYSVFPDSKNNLWMNSLQGITKFDKKNEKFVNYGTKDGIACREFNVSAFFKSKSGTIYLGSVNGVTYFNPDSIKPKRKIPKVAISDFRVFDKPLKKYKVYTDGEEITLSYSQNFISLTFSALDFSEPYLNQYTYKLEGVDNNWIYSGSRRYASYTNLEPGRYVFKVKAFDNDIISEASYSSLIINIEPLFWQTWQFKIIPPLLLALIIGFFIFIKIRSMIAMERLRVKIASDLHDEVGASLSKISLNAGMLPYETKPAAVKSRGEKLISLSQEVISTMSDIVWSIDARNDKSVNLIDRMKNFALGFAEEKQIELNIKISCSFPNKKIGIEFRQNVYLIFKEAFNNAVKYSGSSKFDFEVLFEGKKFELTLSDNGRGLPVDSEFRGNGLRNMKMRAERINADLQFINSKGLTVRLLAEVN